MNDDALLDFIEQELSGDRRISFFEDCGRVILQITERSYEFHSQGIGSTVREAIRDAMEANKGASDTASLSSPSEPDKKPDTDLWGVGDG